MRSCEQLPQQRSTWTTALLCLALAFPSAAQGPASGHRIVGSLGGGESLMIDSNGVVSNTWSSGISEILGTYADQRGALLRVIETDPLPIGGAAGGLQRVALDGTVLWDFRYDTGGVLSHHDIAELPNGNVLMVAWEEKTRAEAIAAGRDPDLVADVFRVDHIIEVKQTGPSSGEIVWEWYLWDHLVQDFSPTAENFGVVADHPELLDLNYPRRLPFLGDWNHVNGIDYDPVYDRILISADQQSEIWAIDHSTTTEEAAGHTGGRWGKGGDILFRWGNPQAYRAGTEEDRVFNTQHSPRVIDQDAPGAGHYMVFLNNAPDQNNRSVVYELEPPLDENGAFILGSDGTYGPEEPVWFYGEEGFFSPIISSVERLPNGNTLICSGTQGRVFEIDPAGTTVMEYEGGFFSTYFNASYVERWLWADRTDISAGTGGDATFDLIAGSAFAGANYTLLATRAGTEPGIEIGELILPLNPDALTQFLRSNPNSTLFENNVGTLNSNGQAQAQFRLPANSPLAPGETVDFAFLLTDPASGEALFVSNPVPVAVVE